MTAMSVDDGPAAAVNPYAPPLSGTTAGSAPGPTGEYTYRSLKGLATLLTVVLGLVALLEVAALVSAGMSLKILVEWQRELPAEDVELLRTRPGKVALLQSPLMLVAGAGFCWLTAWANRNARAFGATGLQFSPGWSAATYLIPVFWWFWPYQATAEVWRAADVEHQTPWQYTPLPLLLPLWWGAWLFQSAGRPITEAVFNRRGGASGAIGAMTASMVCSLVAIGAAWLAIRMVRELARRHARKHQRLQAPVAAA